ncbi:hypothetical protein DL93DRAFT_1236697 [Clavulina sp. PMI_390]|nr:hypothetical protein DL93DRAFT_1236697 [Clavulina sp. PMI_390]
MSDTKPSTRTSLLTLPLDVFLNIAVVVGDANIIGLTRISWTCTTLHTFIMANRSLWRSIVQKQLYNELIPESSLPLSDMSASQLFLCATRKYRLFSAMSGPRDIVCRRIDIHLSLPDAPEYSDFLVDQMRSPQLVPGGRYVLSLFKGPSAFLICCWDLYISPTQHGTRLPVTTLLLPGGGTWERPNITYAPGCNLMDGSFPLSLEVPTNHGVEISIIQLITSGSNAPQLSLSVKREWPSGLSLRSLVGEWAIVLNHADLHTGEGDSLWNWKSDRVERLASAPGCSLVTPRGAVAIMDVASAVQGKGPEDGHNALAFAVTSFHVDTIASLEAVVSRRNNTAIQDSLPLQQDLHPTPNIAVSKIYWAEQEERHPDPGWISRMMLHRAEETKFFIERDVLISPPPRAWEGRIFSIKTPFEVTTTVMTNLPPNSGDIVDWFTGTCSWNSPHSSGSSPSAAIHEGVVKAAGRQLLSAAKRIVRPLARPREQGTPSSSLVSESTPMLEVQEPLQSSSLVGQGCWSVTGSQEAFQGYIDSPKIMFPSRSYDNLDFKRAACKGFCPRSGTWLFWPPFSAAQVGPLEVASRNYSTLVLLKFD